MPVRDTDACARGATLTRMPSLNAWVAQAEDETALARTQKPSARTHSAADPAGPSSGASGGRPSGVPVADAPGSAPVVHRMPSFGAWGMNQIMAVAEAGDAEAAASGMTARTAGGTGDARGLDDGDAATTATVAVAAETAGTTKRKGDPSRGTAHGTADGSADGSADARKKPLTKRPRAAVPAPPPRRSARRRQNPA